MTARERTFAQDVAAFILNEARRDYNRLGYFPVDPTATGLLVEARRQGLLTRDEMLARYRQLAGRPE